MLTERQKKILKKIVEVYVETNEPVGSKSITEDDNFDYSSATIRNDMAILEESGYLLKTHTSSGRVPSEGGYRMYVSMMMEEDRNKKEDDFDFPLIDEIFERNRISKDDAIKETMALVSDLTKYTSVVLGNSSIDAIIKKIQFVQIDKNLGVLLLVTNQGYVESKKIIIPETISVQDIEKVVNILNENLQDCTISSIDETLKAAMLAGKIKERIHYYDVILSVFVNTISNMVENKYYLSGQSNLMSYPEFQDVTKVRDLLKVMEQKEIMKLVDFNNTGITVKIGHDNMIKAMEDCTLITVPYEIGDGSKGAVAIIGPKRMEYSKVIPLLEYIAKNMKNY